MQHVLEVTIRCPRPWQAKLLLALVQALSWLTVCDFDTGGIFESRVHDAQNA